jgi:hypothetical protein
MVHYGHDRPSFPQLPPPVCPKCGSHRTQVIGRLEDGGTFIIRCNACGAHSTVMVDDLTREYAERLPFENTGLTYDSSRAGRDGIHRGNQGGTA